MDSVQFGLGVTLVVALSMVISEINERRLTSGMLRQDVNTLQNHTHAADGSINGIRGWY